jgi:hypothetical protein
MWKEKVGTKLDADLPSGKLPGGSEENQERNQLTLSVLELISELKTSRTRREGPLFSSGHLDCSVSKALLRRPPFRLYGVQTADC